MELVSKDDLPLINHDIIRIIMSHQSMLRDIRNKAKDIDLNNFTIDNMTSFVKFCQNIK
jgi:hypothetical protein